VHDWLMTAATGRRPEQLRMKQVASLEAGNDAMLRAAATGWELTLSGGPGARHRGGTLRPAHRRLSDAVPDRIAHARRGSDVLEDCLAVAAHMKGKFVVSPVSGRPAVLDVTDTMVLPGGCVATTKPHLCARCCVRSPLALA